MNISKTTFNMAKSRGLELTVEDLGERMALCFWQADNECEWMFSYTIHDDKLTWGGNIYLPQEIKEELPATIFDERQLRNVIKFVAKEMPEVF
ncbi:hypothetical protein [Hafnia phage Pocis76]|uniref:Uncharacterized protein n=1 Tax=Hafnia phage Pocis76 TaxID=2831174 RepID=A0A8E7FNU9_9CAUD|nr:hypothetical protein [Hafnia phage Pocis76]